MYEKNLPDNIGIRKEFADAVTEFINWAKTQFAFMDGRKFVVHVVTVEIISSNPQRRSTIIQWERNSLSVVCSGERLYAFKTITEHMSWHATHETESGVMCHPSDAEAWKYFNETHPDFALEPRNVHLVLCADGFAPHGQYGKSYSCWPVIITPYNLPPGMCMKSEFLHTLKKKVKNKAAVEASICEAYIVEEISTFATHYFEPDVVCKRRRPRRNDDGLNNESVKHISIFNHPGRPYGASKMRYINDPSNQITDPILKMLAWGPSQRVLTWPAYFVNGYNFHTADSLGRPPTLMEQLEMCWKTKVGNWAGPRVANAVKKFQKLSNDLNITSQSLPESLSSTSVNDQRLWLEVIGGAKKGQVWGIGSEARASTCSITDKFGTELEEDTSELEDSSGDNNSPSPSDQPPYEDCGNEFDPPF
ncbi:UNVERIFIED_CONTAM: hypothetical protein Slati_4269600 [Sesamum latifolium]|uniref:Uncharacterized protein n=1 Tax=Sesamum latifolium TaxID=2727402 RepID=A0AAW2TDP0_9LAMI